MSAINEFKKLLAEAASAQKKIDEKLKEEESIVNKTARYLQTKNDNIPAAPKDIEAQRWNDPLRPLDKEFVTLKQMNDHYGLFLQRIQQQMSTMTGGGEVNFRYLDDVNRATMSAFNDNWVLEYDAATQKVQFTDKIGPITHVAFDINHITGDESVGTITWNNEDETLNIFHPNGVVQQVGQELYAYVRNKSGSDIPNGTVVRFAGAEQNGTARILVNPFLADGTHNSLYIVGIATETIANGEDGRICVWGKLRDVDTSAFNVGDILYVSPTVSGGLTNVKPTAPNNVIPVAAVIRKDSEVGELFVRPSVVQDMFYGRFASTVDQPASVVNTAYPITFNDTELSNGVSIGTPTSRIVVSQSGFYQFDLSIQASATSNKGIVTVWFRKNGVDIPYSSRRSTIVNNDTLTMTASIQVSLDANDYVEMVWAASASGILLDANATPVIGPPLASVLLSVGQIQL